ncbi:MAG TPA: ABC transporter substrate-binding protein [Phototrophicaceae bacterium]|jgi:iron(III) transport system substrate-binding protein|nr:ABC transporter substrate-binding protein [Phototrophicaceae bacterium]
MGTLALLFLFFSLLSGSALGQSAELLNQAKKEGEVILYTTMTVGDFEHFNKAAKEKYPFLSIRHVYLSSARQTARVMQEFRAGRVQADVLGNSPEPLLYLKQQGVLSAYKSPETANLLKGAWDPEGYWSGMTTDLLVTGFNPRLISRAAAPKNYDEYLRPQFKGQLAVNRGVPYPLTGMVSLLGEEQGIAYFKKLSQQDLRLVEGYTHTVNLMAAGEYPLTAFMQVSKLEAMKRKDAPVDWLPSAPTLATISTVAIVKNPLHPAAAQLLIDFYLSAEGQRGLAAAGKIPLRRGVKSPSRDIDQLMESGNLHVILPEGGYDRYMKIYNEYLGAR